MVKNGHFLVKNEFQRPRLGGVFLIAKSVSLLSSRTDFDLWKSFQSRLLRPDGRLRRNQYKVRNLKYKDLNFFRRSRRFSAGVAGSEIISIDENLNPTSKIKFMTDAKALKFIPAKPAL